MSVGATVLLAALLAASAPPVRPRYGATLAAAVLARHHVVKGVRIAATARDGAPIVVIGGRAATGVSAMRWGIRSAPSP